MLNEESVVFPENFAQPEFEWVEKSRQYWRQRLEKEEKTKNNSFGSKGDTRRLFQLAVCIADLEYASLTTISRATGQNKGTIDYNIERLARLGFKIEKHGAAYKLEKWADYLNPDRLREFVMACDQG